MSRQRKDKRKQKNKPKVAPQKTRFVENTFEQIVMNPCIMNEDIYKQGIPMSMVGQSIRAEARDVIPNFSEENLDDIRVFNDESNAVELAEKLFREYYGKHVSLDKTLNKYAYDSDWDTTPDIIDFCEYMKSEKDPVVSAGYYALKYKDPALLWSQGEYTRIQLTDSISYILHRKNYDEEKKAVTYTGVMYAKRVLVKNVEIEFPVISFEITAGIGRICDINTTSPFEQEVISFYKDVFEKKAVEYDDLHIDVNGLHICSYAVHGTTPIWEITRYFKKYWRQQLSDDKFGRLTDILVKLAQEFYNIETESSLYMSLRQHLSIAIACIIVTNGYIIEEKMSKPVPVRKSTANIMHETADVTATNSDSKTVPTHRTRHLGSDLKITTCERPVRPTVERIIRYTKSEWGRRGFIRHYKSGKTVMIAPVTVHRKCVNIQNTDDKTKKQQGVKYIIHPDKNKK